MPTKKTVGCRLRIAITCAAFIASTLAVRAESVQYARAIGEPPQAEPSPAPRRTPAPTPPPAPAQKPSEPVPAEPTAATDEQETGFQKSYIWIGLGVAAALAALGGGGGGGGGGSTPSH
ncbi:MAG: hypothetical protein ACLGHO_10005 [Gammaproteobacteria bacterium]